MSSASTLMKSRPLQARAEGRELVGFLNRWACRLSSVKTPGLIAGWAHDHMTRLEQFEPLTILDAELPDHADELGSLHDDLIADVKAGGVLNMSDAAASKTLHMLIPELFVMWDKEIKRSAPGGYGAYQRQMHKLARRLAAETGVPIGEVETQLQRATRLPSPQAVDQVPRRVQLVRGRRPRSARAPLATSNVVARPDLGPDLTTFSPAPPRSRRCHVATTTRPPAPI